MSPPVHMGGMKLQLSWNYSFHETTVVFWFNIFWRILFSLHFFLFSHSSCLQLLADCWTKRDYVVYFCGCPLIIFGMLVCMYGMTLPCLLIMLFFQLCFTCFCTVKTDACAKVLQMSYFPDCFQFGLRDANTFKPSMPCPIPVHASLVCVLSTACLLSFFPLFFPVQSRMWTVAWTFYFLKNWEGSLSCL